MRGGGGKREVVQGKTPITDEGRYCGAVDLEVSGRPFAKGTGGQESVSAKVAICYLLQYFLADGWRILVCCRLLAA